MPNKLSQFWQELKRSKVIKAIAMYTGAAFVLIELTNNIVVPLNLPAWTPRLVIIIALVGFPIMVVLSWIFDITFEGLNKTEAIEEFKEQERIPPPGKRKLRVSDVIIALLVVCVAILIYPRIFGIPRLNTMTFPVTILDEFGEKETRRIYKEEYLSRLALFPFINESKDSTLKWLGWGIMDAVCEDQHQFSNLLISWDGAAHRNEQLAYSKSLNYPHFLTGTINANHGSFEITTRLYQTADGALIAERNYSGNDFFSLVDSICVQIRTDIGIAEIVINTTPDLSIDELMTDNLEAFGNYVLGKYYWRLGGCSYTCLSRAIEQDSTFAQACYTFAYWNYNFQKSHESAIRSIAQAMRHRQRVSEYNEIRIRILNYLIHDDLDSFLKLSEWQSNLNPYDFNMLLEMLRIYWKKEMFNRMEDAALKLNELVPNHPPYKIDLAITYRLLGKQDKEIDVLNALLEDNPKDVESLLMTGEFFLHKQDLGSAEATFNKAILLMPEEERHWSKLLDHIDFMRELNDPEELLNSFKAIYRDELGEFGGEIKIFQNQLLWKPWNQAVLFIYPISDTVCVSAFKNGDTYDFIVETFIRNEQGKLVQIKDEHWGNIGYYGSNKYWIEDSLILKAKALLDNGMLIEALSAFRVAYDQNPEHYYLANFIAHMEFITRPSLKSLKTLVNDYVGSYGNINLKMLDDRLFFTNQQGLIYELIPVSEDRFMVPGVYKQQIQIVKDKTEVIGLNSLFRDGTEAFFPKTPN